MVSGCLTLGLVKTIEKREKRFNAMGTESEKQEDARVKAIEVEADETNQRLAESLGWFREKWKRNIGGRIDEVTGWNPPIGEEVTYMGVNRSYGNNKFPLLVQHGGLILYRKLVEISFRVIINSEYELDETFVEAQVILGGTFPDYQVVKKNHLIPGIAIGKTLLEALKLREGHS